MTNPDDIIRFYQGENVSDEVLAQIEEDLDDPNSEVSRIERRSAELTRIAFDPDGPLFGKFLTEERKERD